MTTPTEAEMLAIAEAALERNWTSMATVLSLLGFAQRKAEQFIVNGCELGFIRMPDADTPDSAHDTLPASGAALAAPDVGEA